MNREEKMNHLQEKLGIRFQKPELLTDALTHPSSHEGRDAKQHRTFERLEFFGDSLLNLTVTEELLTTFPDLDEGHLSKFRSTLVSREAIFHIFASPLRLDEYIVVGPGEDSKHPREKAKILADVSEAILAAIYFDQGLAAVRNLILSHYRPHLSREGIRNISYNSKGALQEWVQKRYQRLPEYTFERKGGIFICRVNAGADVGSAIGEGGSKKQAAQCAAARLLEQFETTEISAVVASAPSEPSAPSPAAEAATSDQRRESLSSIQRPVRHPKHRSPRTPHRARTSGRFRTPHPRESNPRTAYTPRPREARPKPSPAAKPPFRKRSGPPSEADTVDWRAWQSSAQKKSASPPEPSSKNTESKKVGWSERLRKLTGRITKK